MNQQQTGLYYLHGTTRDTGDNRINSGDFCPVIGFAGRDTRDKPVFRGVLFYLLRTTGNSRDFRFPCWEHNWEQLPRCRSWLIDPSREGRLSATVGAEHHGVKQVDVESSTALSSEAVCQSPASRIQPRSPELSCVRYGSAALPLRRPSRPSRWVATPTPTPPDRTQIPRLRGSTSKPAHSTSAGARTR
jgi:hypothetical protein